MIITGQPPYGIKNTDRITERILKESKPKIKKPSPLDQALKYAQVLREPSVVSKAQVAMRFGVSRARVCQMLNLLELDNRIIHYLQSIEDVDEHNFFTEHRLRRIAIMEGNKQLVEFNRIRQEAFQEADLI